MANQIFTIQTLQDFADALKKNYSHHGDYAVSITKDMLTVDAEFYTHRHTYRIKLTKEQKAEINKNLVYQKKHPYSAADIVNADDDIISLFTISLRKEIIDGVLVDL